MMKRLLAGWFNRLPWFVILCVVCLGTLFASSRPLHADEAGQWSLLAEGQAHSATQDRFHGPALGLIARATLGLLQVDLGTASEGALRSVPLLFALTLFLAPRVTRFTATDLGWRPWTGLVAVAACGRFIQEPILAVALAWSTLLWLRADVAGASTVCRWRALAGAFAGLALACKVTAALYLFVAGLSFLWLSRRQAARPGVAAFWVATCVSWALWQSSFLTDLPGLAGWWLQLARAFGIASGISVEPLRLVSPWPWVISGLLLSAAAYGRWRLRAAKPWGQHPFDPLLLAAASVFLLHAALPYKTPWLLMAVDTLVLVVLLPELLLDQVTHERLGPVVAHLFSFYALSAAFAAAACLGFFRWVSDVRYAYVETRDAVPALARAIREVPGAAGLTIQVKGANYWPLPYYLRGLRVGYGDFAGAGQADVRWIEAAGAEAPEATGYRVFPVELRAGELWWLMVREPLAGSLAPRR